MPTICPNLLLKNKIMENDLAIKYFRKSYFWDCDPNIIKINSHIVLIIDRVLSQSLELEKDLIILEKLYTKKKIIDAALSSTQIFGNERIVLISEKYNLNSLEFYNFYKEELKYE